MRLAAPSRVIDGDVVEASVYSLSGGSSSPDFVKNVDSIVSAVGILMSPPGGDDHTTYFVFMHHPLLEKRGLQKPSLKYSATQCTVGRGSGSVIISIDFHPHSAVGRHNV